MKSAAGDGKDPTPTHFFSREMSQGDLKPRLRVRYQNALSPLTIQITAPKDGAVLHESPITVTGTVSDPAAAVTVNGVLAPIAGNTFQVSIQLNEGANTAVASADDPSGRKASSQISLSLITRGSVEGMVTDSSTSLPLPSASVSVMDALSVTQTASAGQDGRYRMTGVAAGAFSGSARKNGYHPFNFSGNTVPGQTVVTDAALNPIVPAIANIFVADVVADSARITWVTDMPAESWVDYGSTLSYGNTREDSSPKTTHQVTLGHLSPETTYHFKITSRNVFGFSSSSGDQTFTTPALTGPPTLAITIPQNGATISRSDARVEGTITNALGLETGVVVNGVLAGVLGSQFVANHVPLTEGENTITAKATDAKGNTGSSSVVVYARRPDHFVKIRANVQSGIVPLEVVLTLDSDLNLENAVLTHTGPGEVGLVSRTENAYRMKIETDGSYDFMIQVTDGHGRIYEDSVGISAFTKQEINTLVTGKWEEMRGRLGTGDIDGAMEFFEESARGEYLELFKNLQSLLPEIAREMSDVQLIKYTGDTAIFDLRTVRDGREYSFQVLFTKDANGIWKIQSF